mmetsp:Transcript_34644/g.106360  ORF Transcript_34644/g.106360 Transcript_34644/m.106360 type:complete len:85 (+) Transcript_34644:35-289(+)
MLLARWEGRALRSAHAEALGSDPPTCLDESVDYIFFGPQGQGVGQLALLGVLVPPRPLSYAEAIQGLGSDHVPLVADFGLLAEH